MIDIQEQTFCKAGCGTPIQRIPGHRTKQYCSDRCRQRAHRGLPPTNVVTIVTNDDRQVLDQKNIAIYQEKLAVCAARIEKLERQVEVQRQRLGQSYQSTERITELEQELAEANELIEKLASKKSTTPLKKSYQERLQRWGEKLDWPALDIHTRVQPGRKAWRVFMINESNDQLIRAIIAAERMKEK